MNYQDVQINGIKKDLALCVMAIDEAISNKKGIDWEAVSEYLSMVSDTASSKLAVGIAAKDTFISYTSQKDHVDFSKDDFNDIVKMQVNGFKKDVALCFKGLEKAAVNEQTVDWQAVSEYLSMLSDIASSKLAVGIAANDTFISYTTLEDDVDFSVGIKNNL